MKNNEHYRKRQMARIIKLAFLIYHEPSEWTRPHLAERFEVNKTTIQRDIDLLREMGIDIQSNGKKGYEIVSGFDFLIGNKE